MFQDEAGFGRINKPKTGENFFLILPNCNTDCMNVFLKELSKEYINDKILLVCDRPTWHKSKGLKTPENIEIMHIPPYTPEMNPTEQIGKQVRTMGFKNESFNSLTDVVDRLCQTINKLTKEIVKSINHRD